MRIRVDRDAAEGAVPTRYLTGSQEFDVRVRLPREATSDEHALGNILLFRQNGTPLFLRDVVSFELGERPAHIVRENQSRAVQINGDINTQATDHLKS